MDRRLESIENWQYRLFQANYRLTRLAQVCGTSRRGLYTFISHTYCCAPRLWIERMRLEAASEEFSLGKSLKQIAQHLGLTAGSFTRLILRSTGRTPSTYFSNNRMDTMRPPNLQSTVVAAHQQVFVFHRPSQKPN